MKKSKEPTHWLWKYVAAILFFAVAVNGAMYLPIPTLSTLTSSDWLGFWGGYLGGAIGCIPAIAALLHSQAESKRLHEETAEAQRCSVLPIFSVSTDARFSDDNLTKDSCCVALNPDGTVNVKTSVTYLDTRIFLNQHSSNDFMRFNCQLQNVGLGPALNLELYIKLKSKPNQSRVIFNTYGTGEAVHFLLCVPKKATSNIQVLYSDIFGNRYSQSFSIAYTKSDDSYTVLPVSAPTLVKPE
ncbi:hypothetical protein [Victivallis lenta]|jgi:hypothetical protein|uniref:hypothetical protein n=1 Tax=Victivallis lenta TaxID=2606640 RepID=UPI0020631070|nr:MAG TPA: hypothetical protein [Caudoviricetes sp.]